MFAGLVAGWVVVFVGTFSETSGGAFLMGTTNPVVGPLILDIWRDRGTFPELAALTLIVTAVQAGVVLIVLTFARESLRNRVR
jgi:ABC-type Fe3+ transport system permease subunit